MRDAVARTKADPNRSRREDQLVAGIEFLVVALRECSEDLALEIEARYAGTLHYPVQQRRYDRDMAVVRRVQALLAEYSGDAEAAE